MEEKSETAGAKMISNHLVDQDIMDEEYRVSPSIVVINMRHVLHACKMLVRSPIFPSAALGRTLWRQMCAWRLK